MHNKSSSAEIYNEMDKIVNNNLFKTIKNFLLFLIYPIEKIDTKNQIHFDFVVFLLSLSFFTGSMLSIFNASIVWLIFMVFLPGPVFYSCQLLHKE